MLRKSLLQLAKQPTLNITRNFSVTRYALASTAKDSSQNLVKCIEKEIEYENGAAEPEMPSELQKFLANSPFKLAKESSGLNEVTLTRKYGNETVNVVFNIVPESTGEEMLIEDEQEEPMEDTIMSMTVDVTKKDGDKDLGTMTFYAVTGGEDGFFINEVEFSQDSKLIKAETAENDFNRKSRYMGPRFDELDEELQNEFAYYLEDRGVDGSLCEFIQNYAEWKEQNEYKDWLVKVKDFISKQ